MYINIRWARIFSDGKTAKKAQFSGDLCLNDGMKVCTINRLCILNTADKITGEPTVYIGSMSERLPRGDTIYALTWFPDAKKGNPIDIKAREDFANECIKAVAAFQEQEASNMDKRRNGTNEDHPALKPLADVAKKVTSLQ
tara:strand:- start:29240 stop:29662 length:423 start_codon:yes stop_codon:yes gene_type:complete